MQAELRKVAELLRKHAQTKGPDKMVKCAQVAQAALGLETLRRKIGR